jgi:hypothetical protein
MSNPARKKNNALNIRISDDEKRLVEEQAYAEGFDSVTGWVLWLIRRALRLKPLKQSREQDTLITEIDHQEGESYNGNQDQRKE